MRFAWKKSESKTVQVCFVCTYLVGQDAGNGRDEEKAEGAEKHVGCEEESRVGRRVGDDCDGRQRGEPVTCKRDQTYRTGSFV